MSDNYYLDLARKSLLASITGLKPLQIIGLLITLDELTNCYLPLFCQEWNLDTIKMSAMARTTASNRFMGVA